MHAVFTRYGYSPADESPFVNAIFDPAAVDTFFHADASVKEMLLTYHRNTNYSVVDRELIHELYRRHYQETVAGETRLHFALESAQVGEWDLNLADDSSRRSLRHDQAFGYREPVEKWERPCPPPAPPEGR